MILVRRTIVAQRTFLRWPGLTPPTCVANAGLLTSTASANTTYLVLLALLHAAKWARNTFEPRDVPHKLLLFTDSARAYNICTRVSEASSSYPGILADLIALFLELHSNLNIAASIAWVPAHSGIEGNEWARSEARAAAGQRTSLIVLPISNASPPEVTVRKALAQQRRRQILRCLREVREDRTEEHERPVPPMPEKLPRATQTLVRRLATNTAFSPALRHKFYGNDPGEGLCLQCCVPATAEHLVWDCQCYALFRARTLDTLPEDIRPTTYFDWVLPVTRNITTLTLLWTSLAAFVYADEGPRGVLGTYHRHSYHPTRPPWRLNHPHRPALMQTARVLSHRPQIKHVFLSLSLQ
ncbi:hypothetical protein HPB48_015299 [Haemaphysalis longicornis]|uniref:RNase H type-1 domain-containing protein n=1 Tax=Haemaphysalis longicornis TaxID=44386 RepID=A0A9J6FRV0_HAELO|nr:hypothetical protein HPB48_015299 [Haemaphysalis longicornis]